MHILHQEFIKINYKIIQNKSRYVPAFVISAYFISVPVFPFRASFTLSKEVM